MYLGRTVQRALTKGRSTCSDCQQHHPMGYWSRLTKTGRKRITDHIGICFSLLLGCQQKSYPTLLFSPYLGGLQAEAKKYFSSFSYSVQIFSYKIRSLATTITGTKYGCMGCATSNIYYTLESGFKLGILVTYSVSIPYCLVRE